MFYGPTDLLGGTVSVLFDSVFLLFYADVFREMCQMEVSGSNQRSNDVCDQQKRSFSFSLGDEISRLLLCSQQSQIIRASMKSDWTSVKRIIRMIQRSFNQAVPVHAGILHAPTCTVPLRGECG